jgi:dihydroneopterin aldolase
MDTILIQGLRVEAMIGAHNWERHVTRQLRIDLELRCDASLAAASDQLADALDYKAVSDRVRALAGMSRFRLIESLAEQLASTLMAEFGIGWLRITVHKPAAVPEADDIAVRIERSRL